MCSSRSLASSKVATHTLKAACFDQHAPPTVAGLSADVIAVTTEGSFHKRVPSPPCFTRYLKWLRSWWRCWRASPWWASQVGCLRYAVSSLACGIIAHHLAGRIRSCISAMGGCSPGPGIICWYAGLRHQSPLAVRSIEALIEVQLVPPVRAVRLRH
jgi:hypothetical protein